MVLFISYAHTDTVRVAEFAEVLRAGGFEPWWDDRLLPGDDWKRGLRDRISSCEAFLCLLSHDAIESEWCQWELAEAASQSKPIIPVLLRVGTQVPESITRLQYLDAPIQRIGSPFTPVGFHPILEKAILPNEERIFKAAIDLLAY